MIVVCERSGAGVFASYTRERTYLLSSARTGKGGDGCRVGVGDHGGLRMPSPK